MAAWLPRVLVIDRYVTVDERGWLYRSGALFWALANADWASTYRVGHPGVTVMWAGLPAYLARFPQLAQAANVPSDYAALEAAMWQVVPPLDMLISARHVIVIVISLIIAASYLPLCRLFGAKPAFVAALFVAWSPFFLSLSITLHPDGLLAAFSLLTVLLTSQWIFVERRYATALLSGIACGLSFLTKTPAITLALWCGLALLIVELRRQRAWLHALRTTAWWYLIWIAAATATYVALWPALWVDPYSVFQGIVEQNMGHLISGHALQNYFLAQVVDDPGPLFYPVAMLFRLSPITTLGLLLAVVAVWKRFPPFERASSRNTIGGMLLFALLFTLVMTAGAKKFDRYVIPAIVALDVVAAVGWYAVLASTVKRIRQGDRPVALARLGAILLLLVVIVHGTVGFIHYPYYGLYYNPLLGGTRTAPQVLLVGWGEGLEEAGHWITEHSDGPANVVSWYPTGPLSFFLPEDATTSQFIDDVHYWFDADYLVLYQNQVQRMNPDADMINHFLAQEPDLKVSHRGLDLVRAYDLAGTVPPSFTGIGIETTGPLTDDIDLAAYMSAAEAVAPGDSAQITLYLKSRKLIEDDLVIHTKLLDPDGVEAWSQSGRPGGIPTLGWPLGEVRNHSNSIPIATDAQAGNYTLMVRLEPIESDVEQPLTPFRVAALVVVQELDAYDVELKWPPNLTLANVSHEKAVAAGQPLLIDFEFSGQWTPGTKMSVRLVGSEGMTWSQVDKLVDREIRYELEVPEDAPCCVYDIYAVVYNGDTQEVYANQNGESASRLSFVLVTKPDID